MLQPSRSEIDSATAWRIAWLVLVMLSVSQGAPLVAVVGLKPIAADLGITRSDAALASSLAWFGAGAGGIAMGLLAERHGVRFTAMLGTVCVAGGLALSTLGEPWQLLAGHGLLLGAFGNGALWPPLLIYVSRWFERKRGAAVALISSGQYFAGVLWPWVFERGIAGIGWRRTMLAFAVLVLATVLPLALFALRPAPEVSRPAPAKPGAAPAPVLGMPPNLVQGLLCAAAFFCCVPMAMPAQHLVAHCTDIGISASHGAAMLSVLLFCAFLSRQFWGWASDKVGGLATVFLGSLAQAIASTGFLLTQDEAGLFFVAGAFGLGFAGIIPAYFMAVRSLFPAREMSWRVPTQMFCGLTGMAFGGWLAGAIYDRVGFYGAAFATGIGFNILNLMLVGWLLWRERRSRALRLALA